MNSENFKRGNINSVCSDNDYSKIECCVKEKIEFKVNTRIIDCFKENNSELIEEMEEKIGSAISIKEDLVQVLVPKSMLLKSNQIINEYIELGKLKVKNEIYEYKPTSEQAGLRIILKSSLQIQAILLENTEFIRIKFSNFICHNHNEIRKEFSKFGNLIDFKVNNKTNSNTKSYGHVIFEKPEHAQQAYNELNGRIFETLPLMLQPAISISETIHSSSATLKAKWFISKPTSKAIITLNLNQINVQTALFCLKKLGFNCKAHETEINKTIFEI